MCLTGVYVVECVLLGERCVFKLRVMLCLTYLCFLGGISRSTCWYFTDRRAVRVFLREWLSVFY